MVKKIAVLVEADAFDRKGLFNAVFDRVYEMKKTGNYDVDFWCLQSCDDVFSSRIRHRTKVPKDCNEIVVDDVIVRLLKYDFSYVDALLFDRLHCCRPSWDNFVKHSAYIFKNYDFISAHSFNAASLAASTGKPFCITWHGSEIHTHPFRNKAQMIQTQRLMKLARCNVFVSRELLETSDSICKDCRKEVSANGINPSFVILSPGERIDARAYYGLTDTDKGIGYAGNFMKVKNVEALPAIFTAIKDKVGGCKFICAGDGKLKSSVEKSMDLPCTFLGNVQPEEMCRLFNALDLLIVPSLKEGFSLVCAEALACGCYVAGSRVGAIPSIIGVENTSDPIGNNFFTEMADISERLLKKNSRATLSGDYSWRAVVEREEKLFQSLMTD